MADILLIYPQQLPIKLKRDLRPPLNLLYLSAVLLQKKYKVEILDLSIIDDNWQEKIKKIITKEKPLFVGITSLTNYMIRSGLDVAEYIKNNFNIPIVWGGIHARLEPETTIQNPLIDVVAYDEGEVIIEELANYFSSKSKKIEDIKGIYYKQNNKIIKNPLSNEHYNLDNLPFIPFDLININNYANKDYLFFGFKSDISFSLETSRGCKFRCGYCVETVIKNKWRGMSAERVIEHIEHINKKYNVKALVFVDDNFFVDEQRSEIILKKIIEKKFEMEYYAPIRSDLICKRGLAFLKLMEQAGFKSAGLGVESGSNRVLKYLKKGEKIENTFEANKLLSKINILAQMNFITCFPTETIEDTMQSFLAIFKLYKENKNARCCIGKLIPTPNSPVYFDCLKNGLKKPEKMEDWVDLMDYNFLRNTEWLTEPYQSWIKNNWYIVDLIFRINWLRGELAIRKKNIIFSKIKYFVFYNILLFCDFILKLRFRLKFYGLNFERHFIIFFINFFNFIFSLKK